MRHAFRFPPHVRRAVHDHVRRAIEELSPTRFRQEPAYTAALLGRLAGVAYEDQDGSVVFKTTNIDSIGRGAAEQWSGADFAITAEIRQRELSVNKAILAQAKLGSLEDLPSSEHRRLIDQVRHMRRLTRSPKVLVIPEVEGRRDPEMVSGTNILRELDSQPVPLADYFVRRVLTTLDGDTRRGFVDAVQDSSLKQLRVFVTLA